MPKREVFYFLRLFQGSALHFQRLQNTQNKTLQLAVFMRYIIYNCSFVENSCKKVCSISIRLSMDFAFKICFHRFPRTLRLSYPGFLDTLSNNKRF